MPSFTRKQWWLFAIFLLALAFRLIFITSFPNSLRDDEMHYAVNAKPFFLTGRDITQSVSLLDIATFHYPPGEVAQAELPYFLQILSLGIFSLGVAGAVFPNIILGTLTVLLIYLLAKELFQNERIALIGALVAAINPWSVAMSRMSYEVIPAVFFYLCTFYVLLRAKGWHLLLSFPLALLAFYSYIATKVIFIPLVIVFVVFSYLEVNKRRYKGYYILLLVLSILFLDFFLMQVRNPATSRVGEVLTPFSSAVVTQSQLLLHNPLAGPLSGFFDNQLVVFARVILTNILTVFSPVSLFLSGDYLLSNNQYGLFYPLDLFFIIVGCLYLPRYKKKLGMLFFCLIAIAIIPQVFRDSTGDYFSTHIALLVPFFIMIIAVGIERTYLFLKQKNYRFLMGALLFVGVVSVGNFFQIYFSRGPLSTELFFSDRVLTRYLTLVKSKNQQVTVYTNNPAFLFKEYIFYNNRYSKDLSTSVAKALLKNGPFVLKNVRFLSCASRYASQGEGIILFGRECFGKFGGNPPVSIPLLSSNLGRYYIRHDPLCHASRTISDRLKLSLSDFVLERLSTKQFCETYILRPG